MAATFSRDGLVGDDGRSELKFLLLAGGMSIRMGQPKHLLQLPNGQPLFLQITKQVKDAYPGLQTCFISLRRDFMDVEVVSGAIQSLGLKLHLVYDDLEAERSSLDYHNDTLGPAAGLRAAHALEPETTFLVVACDFPLLTAETITFLLESYKYPITCYHNSQGFCEPLLGIWSADALRQLSKNMQNGLLAPNKVVRQLNGHTILPPNGHETWLLNTNTRSEWQSALEKLSKE